MPGRIPPAAGGGGSALLRRGLRPPFRAATTASQPEVAQPPPPYEPETADSGGGGGGGGGGGKVGAGGPAPEVFVSATSAAASTALRRHLGSTSFSFRRKRVLGVPVDENNVPQIDRAVSPLPSAAGSPTATHRGDVAGTSHVVATREFGGGGGGGRQPIYTRRFASLRLPSVARSTGVAGSSSTARPHPSSSLLSPAAAAAAANGSSDHRPLGGSYARMQLLQNIGKH